MIPFTLLDFVRESNRIEGITREPYANEVEATGEFLASPPSLIRLKRLVAVYAPGKRLRNRFGMDVRVGNHVPPYGGDYVEGELVRLLADISMRILTPYEGHQQYETLHPFMDGNGRSGRAIWLSHMGGIAKAPLGFLHTWYYQSLQAQR